MTPHSSIKDNFTNLAEKVQKMYPDEIIET